MGAWIEILFVGIKYGHDGSHPTMGAWIEIVSGVSGVLTVECRTPRWVRGLKFFIKCMSKFINTVAPHDGCVD